MAVLLLPVILLTSASKPLAVLSLVVVLLKSAIHRRLYSRAGCQVKKRIITLGGIAAGIACRRAPEQPRKSSGATQVQTHQA